MRVEHVLSLMERAYDVESADEAWVEGIATACAPWLDGGAGVHAFAVDLSTGATESPTLAGGDAAWQSAWRSAWWDGFIRKIAPETLRALVEFAPVSHTTELWAAVAARVPTFEELLARRWHPAQKSVTEGGIRYPDSLNVVAVDTSGEGIVLCGNRERVADRPVPESMRWVVQRLVAHVTAGKRLRKRLSQRSLVEGADAIVDARGALVHVEPSAEVARSVLHKAAIDVIHARDARGEDADAVLALWRALYADGFSVIDTFDTDGRRFVVARANRPEAPSARHAAPAGTISERDRRVLALVARGCSNKLIAYQLDMSPSAVAASLARARKALGVTTAAELVTAARRWAREEENDS